MLPFFFSLTHALCGGFKHGLLNGLNDRVRILASFLDIQQQHEFVYRLPKRPRHSELNGRQ